MCIRDSSDATTNDSFRLYAASGQLVIASRESGTWTTRFDISDSGNATFAGSVDVGTFTLAGSGIVADAGMTLQIGGGSVNALTLANTSGNATFAKDINAPGLVYNATNKYLSISHWSSPPTPAAMLHLSDNSNDLDVPQIRIEGRENPGDTVLDIAVKDADVRFNLVEGSTDAASGYGRMHFKTNASVNSSNPTRGGFLFQSGPNSSLINVLDLTNEGNATFAGNVTIGSVDTPVGAGLNIGNASPTIQLFDTTNNAKLLMYTQDNNSIIGTYSNHPMSFYTDSGETLTLNTDHSATFTGDVTVNGLLKGPSSIVSVDNRLKIIGSNHQLNIGQWDTVSHRIEGDANRPVHITSYQGHVYLGTSGSHKLDVHNSGITVTGTIVKSGGTSSQFLMADGSVSTHISPNGHLDMNDNNINNVGDLDFTRSFPFNVASKDYDSSNTTGYSTSSSSYDDWIKIAEFGEAEGATYLNIKSDAHSSFTCVMTRGYHSSNAASLTLLNSTHNPNSTYAQPKGIRILRESDGSGGTTTTYSVQVRLHRPGSHAGYKIYCKAWGGGYNNVNGCLDFLATATNVTNDGTGCTVLATIDDFGSGALDQLSEDYTSLWAAKPIVGEKNIISKSSISVEKDGGELVLTTTGSGHGSITTTDSKDLNISAASGTVYVNDDTNISGKITAAGDPGVVVTGSGNSTIHVASTGTGLAGMYMDASNGDFVGSDYVFIGQDNDKTFRLSLIHI